MKSNNYIQIQGWMVTKLELSGNNLLAFALIYGFSQDGQSQFTGSINYVCKWLGCSRPTAVKALKELTETDLVLKNQVEVNNVTFNKYAANVNKINTVLTGSKESLPPTKNLNGGSKESCLGGSKESLPNNTIINNTINNNKSKKTSRFIKPEIEEVFNYMLEKGIERKVAQKESEKLWHYYDSKGWMIGKNKMKNWKSAATNWINRMNDYNPSKKEKSFASNR